MQKMTQLDIRSSGVGVGQKNPTPTPTPSAVGNPTPIPPKNIRLFTTPTPAPTPQPCCQHSLEDALLSFTWSKTSPCKTETPLWYFRKLNRLILVEDYRGLSAQTFFHFFIGWWFKFMKISVSFLTWPR